jgi:hypothetical protein
MKAIRNIVIVLLVIALGIYVASWFVEQSREDPTRPTITSDVEVLESPCAYSQEQMLSGLHAYDERDGDLTSEILVGEISRFQQEGTCEVTYVVFDSSNQPATLTRQVVFTDYRSPQFTLTQPLVFVQGRGSSASSYVGATDMLDGDISSSVRMTDSNISYSVAGDYEMNVEVTNSFGDLAEATLPVHIVEQYQQSLTIELTQNLVYLSVGETFQPYNYVSSVTTSNGSQIDTDNVTAVSNVDTSTPGCYEVQYNVSSGGSQGITWLVVIVE